MVEIGKCEICGCLLSVEEQQTCTIGQFRVCKRHYEFLKQFAYLVRSEKI